MKLLQLIITAFMFGATSLLCWIYYRLNAVGGDSFTGRAQRLPARD